MYVITVMPISRKIGKETLTYFYNEDIVLGSLVSVPVRNKNIPGIVLSSVSAIEMRSEIKNMPFIVKKIDVRKRDLFFSESFIKAVKEASLWFASPEGSLIGSLTHRSLFELPSPEKKLSGENKSAYTKFEESAIQAEEEERLDIYKGLIRESFAKKESIFLCMPTEDGAKNILEKLKKGIEEYSLVFFPNLPKKNFREAYKKITESIHPLLVVGTSSYLPILREDTKTIIIEEESSRFYKQRERPFLDAREFMRILAKNMNSKIIYADTLLRVETLYRIKEGLVSEYYRIMAKRRKILKTLLVNMKKPEPEGEENMHAIQSEKPKKFQIFSDELKEMVLYASSHNKTVFVFAARRGMASQTVCLDCGTTVLCSRCESPTVLHKQGQSPNFICHHCGEKRDAHETCKKCGGWRLEALGIGIEKIADELNKIIPEKVWRIDSDACKTSASAQKIASDFLKKGGVLVGTEMAIQYLSDRSVDYSAIASIDSLFSLPDFRIEERIMHIILGVKGLARDNFLLQGRNVDHPIIDLGVSGDLSNFAKRDLEIRKKFGYPPFKILIKITIAGQKDMIREQASSIARTLAEYKPSIFPAFIKTIRGKTLVHMLIKREPISWPDKKLRDILMCFPPSVSVKIDPESLL